PADAVGQCAAPGVAGLVAGGVVVLEDDADGKDLRLRGDAHDTVVMTGTMPVTSDDPGHGGAVPGPVVVARAGPEADHVLALKDIAGEVGVGGVYAGVQDGDGDARALGGVPGVLGVEGVQGPLLRPDLVGLRRGGGEDQGEGGGEQDGQGGAAP